VVCQVAKAKFSVPRTVARINNPKNETIFKQLGIDTTVSATAAVLAQIEQELPTHPLIPLLRLKGGGLEIVEVKVPQRASVVGKRIGELLLPQQSLITLIVDSDGTPRVPSNDTIIRAEDQVVAVTRRESEDALRAALTNSSSPAAPGP
jgi:trk system potassium uptake protein TrkA